MNIFENLFQFIFIFINQHMRLTTDTEHMPKNQPALNNITTFAFIVHCRESFIPSDKIIDGEQYPNTVITSTL